jgi:hypothetical protein
MLSTVNVRDIDTGVGANESMMSFANQNATSSNDFLPHHASALIERQLRHASVGSSYARPSLRGAGGFDVAETYYLSLKLGNNFVLDHQHVARSQPQSLMSEG